jgi:hypothetical protein
MGRERSERNISTPVKAEILARRGGEGWHEGRKRMTLLSKEQEMNVEEVFQFMNGESLAVLATATENGQPEAALM